MSRRLACGDVEGRLEALFGRVRAIQGKSGRFDVRPRGAGGGGGERDAGLARVGSLAGGGTGEAHGWVSRGVDVRGGCSGGCCCPEPRSPPPFSAGWRKGPVAAALHPLSLSPGPRCGEEPPSGSVGEQLPLCHVEPVRFAVLPSIPDTGEPLYPAEQSAVEAVRVTALGQYSNTWVKKLRVSCLWSNGNSCFI